MHPLEVEEELFQLVAVKQKMDELLAAEEASRHRGGAGAELVPTSLW